MDKTEIRLADSVNENRSPDGRLWTCSLADGSEFVLTADAPKLGKHDVSHSGRIRDAFAAAFQVKYHGKNVATTLMSFNDDDPDCVNYAMSGNTLHALTDRATFRFMAANGKRGGSVLVVSRDGGHSFSDNIHPNALEKAGGNQQIHAAFQEFGYYRSRFRVVGSQYQLEITDPLNFEKFLLFVSSDGGKMWAGPVGSIDPTVFSSKEVDLKRAFFASNEWSDKVFKATSDACNQRPGIGCAVATSQYWDTQWDACVSERPSPACLKMLPDPTPRFPDGEQGK